MLRLISVSLTDGQLDALVSFTFTLDAGYTALDTAAEGEP